MGQSVTPNVFLCLSLFRREKCSLLSDSDFLSFSAMLLGLAIGRIRLQRKKYREINENRKREVATLLRQEKELQARVKAFISSRIFFPPTFPIFSSAQGILFLGHGGYP